MSEPDEIEFVMEKSPNNINLFRCSSSKSFIKYIKI